jgi:hypothetical protein
MQGRPQQQQPYPQPQASGEHEANGLPAFITGGSQPQPNGGPTGHEQGGEPREQREQRFGGHHRRRRRRGGYRPDRPEMSGHGNECGDAPGQAE